MLKISHISKTFNPGTVNEKKAITDLSLELKKGDFATIIGSNGAGKSTLFNAICGDFLTDAGSIELDGRDITFMPQHARAKEIGRLYQDPMRGTAPGMTIEENLALAYLRTAKGKSPFSRISKKDKDAFRERLSLLNMGLEDRMTQPVGLPADIIDDDRIAWEQRDLDPVQHRRAYLAMLRTSGLTVPGQAVGVSACARAERQASSRISAASHARAHAAAPACAS